MSPSENEESVRLSVADEAQERRNAWGRLPNRLFAFLLSADFFFVAIFALAAILGFSQTKAFSIVSLDQESNPASWYSATQIFLVALAFMLLGSKLLPLRRRASDLKRLWMVLGLGFLYLSIDEGGEIHERLGKTLTRVGIKANVHGGGQWVFFYLLIAVALLVFLHKDILAAWRRWRPEMLLFAVGFVLMVCGEIGLEFLMVVHHWLGVARLVEIGFEEGLGMVGISFMAWSAYRVLGYVLSSAPDAELADTGGNA